MIFQSHSMTNKQPYSRVLTEAELAAFAAELDQLKAKTLAQVGKPDADYIRRVLLVMRSCSAVGRGLLMLGWFPPAWLLGSGLLGVAKILENMELGHNIMHGQYDWMNDPKFQGAHYEWDTVGTSDNWRKTHNYMHHTYTNIKGVDDDIGYGVLRLFPEQRWRPSHLGQPLYTILFALLFQWGVAIQELRLGQVINGKKSREQFAKEWLPAKRKIQKQLLKDYVFFPLLAGPAFLPVFTGNLLANGLRNIWTFSIIFCGHFTENAEIFPKSVLDQESRGHWYMRQIRGSSNLTGSRWFHILSGHLSHQIEHHLYPDVPSYRYPQMAVKVQEICRRYGQHYNQGSFARQFGQVLWRIARHTLPDRGKNTQASAA